MVSEDSQHWLAEQAVAKTIAMLDRELTFVGIKQTYDSEQAIRSIPDFPVLVVMCNNFQILDWAVEDIGDVVDAQYNMVIGFIARNENVASLKQELNRGTEAIITALIHSQRKGHQFDYTLLRRGQFNVNFSPIFTNNSATFLADAQVAFSMKATQVEVITTGKD